MELVGLCGCGLLAVCLWLGFAVYNCVISVAGLVVLVVLIVVGYYLISLIIAVSVGLRFFAVCGYC